MVVTNHKPLLPVFNNLHTKLPACIEHWMLHLQPCQIPVVCRPGPEDPAVTIYPGTRLHHSLSVREISEKYVHFVLDKAILKALTQDEVKAPTAEDANLQHLNRPSRLDVNGIPKIRSLLPISRFTMSWRWSVIPYYGSTNCWYLRSYIPGYSSWPMKATQG